MELATGTSVEAAIIIGSSLLQGATATETGSMLFVVVQLVDVQSVVAVASVSIVGDLSNTSSNVMLSKLAVQAVVSWSM